MDRHSAAGVLASATVPSPQRRSRWRRAVARQRRACLSQDHIERAGISFVSRCCLLPIKLLHDFVDREQNFACNLHVAQVTGAAAGTSVAQ